jgi:hypothetical protein
MHACAVPWVGGSWKRKENRARNLHAWVCVRGEDMFRACALDYGFSWDDNLPYAEHSYNNSYQASIEMSPFEVLYGKKCTTPLL